MLTRFLTNFIRRLLPDQRGNVAMIVAAAFPLLIGAAFQDEDDQPIAITAPDLRHAQRRIDRQLVERTVRDVDLDHEIRRRIERF